MNLLLKVKDMGFLIEKNLMPSAVMVGCLEKMHISSEKKHEIAKFYGVSSISTKNLTKLFKVKLSLMMEEPSIFFIYSNILFLFPEQFLEISAFHGRIEFLSL